MLMQSLNFYERILSADDMRELLTLKENNNFNALRTFYEECILKLNIEEMIKFIPKYCSGEDLADALRGLFVSDEYENNILHYEYIEHIIDNLDERLIGKIVGSPHIDVINELEQLAMSQNEVGDTPLITQAKHSAALKFLDFLNEKIRISESIMSTMLTVRNYKDNSVISELILRSDDAVEILSRIEKSLCVESLRSFLIIELKRPNDPDDSNFFHKILESKSDISFYLIDKMFSNLNCFFSLCKKLLPSFSCLATKLISEKNFSNITPLIKLVSHLKSLKYNKKANSTMFCVKMLALFESLIPHKIMRAHFSDKNEEGDTLISCSYASHDSEIFDRTLKYYFDKSV